MDEIWQQVLATWAVEFSDLDDVTQITRVTTRLLMAALLGGVLGYEREQRGKAAGIRTHMLVAIGACLFIMIPLEAGVSDAEMSRVIQGVIAGIGFLGAGAILKGHDEKDLKGLTTAASIWLTAAIGVAAGLGREFSAILCTFLAFGVLYVVPKIVTAIHPDDGRDENDVE